MAFSEPGTCTPGLLGMLPQPPCRGTHTWCLLGTCHRNKQAAGTGLATLEGCQPAAAVETGTARSTHDTRPHKALLRWGKGSAGLARALMAAHMRTWAPPGGRVLEAHKAPHGLAPTRGPKPCIPSADHGAPAPALALCWTCCLGQVLALAPTISR